VGTPAEARIEQIYLAEGRRLVALARVLCGSISDGEDLAQDVFIRAAAVVRRDPTYLQDPVWPWLRVVLVRLAIQRRRRLTREFRALVRIYASVDLTAWDKDYDVFNAIRRLPPRMRACVILHYGEDLPVTEVASIIRCKSATVAAQLYTARQRLRARLTPD
jgi:RNA polymerase sigma-70 factor (ECF subfamily)